MRIRKRFQNPLPSPDLPSPLPPSGPAVAAAAAAPPVAAERGAAAGVKGAEVAAAALVPGGDRCGGGGRGKGGFYPNGPAARPTPFLLPCPPPSGAAAAADGEEGGVPPKPELRSPTEKDSPLYYGHDSEVAAAPKREAVVGKQIGDAHSRNGANSAASRRSLVPSLDLSPSRSLGAEASEASSGQGHMAPLTAEQTLRPIWRKEGGEFPVMKRIAGHHARGRSLGVGEGGGGDEDVVAERDVKPTASTTRRRRAAAFGTRSTMAASTERCDDTVVKEEGTTTDVMPAVAEGNVGVGKGKKRRSPAVLMEGSRCSRVNGRGWRCCQQTLVGYSLCEHHLGKGRLRSVSSVRSNWRRTEEEEEDAGDQHDAGNKRIRRNNVGTVKARSLSSLLHQTDHHHHHHHQYPSPTVLAIAAPPEPIPSATPVARPATAAAPPPRATDTVVA